MPWMEAREGRYLANQGHDIHYPGGLQEPYQAALELICVRAVGDRRTLGALSGEILSGGDTRA
jgi:hypothetical protein